MGCASAINVPTVNVTSFRSNMETHCVPGWKMETPVKYSVTKGMFKHRPDAQVSLSAACAVIMFCLFVCLSCLSSHKQPKSNDDSPNYY